MVEVRWFVHYFIEASFHEPACKWFLCRLFLLGWTKQLDNVQTAMVLYSNTHSGINRMVLLATLRRAGQGLCLLTAEIKSVLRRKLGSFEVSTGILSSCTVDTMKKVPSCFGDRMLRYHVNNFQTMGVWYWGAKKTWIMVCRRKKYQYFYITLSLWPEPGSVVL